MKKSVFITIAILLSAYMHAQDIFEKSAKIGKSVKVELDFDFADQIVIKTWDKNEAYVKAIVNINDNTDNNKYTLTVDESGSNISFEAEIEDLEKISRSNSTYQHGVIIRDDDHCVHLEIDYEVFLPRGTVIDLETISGNIEIIGLEGPMQIETISGFVDVTINPKLDLDFELTTISGSIYSDLDLEIEREYKHMYHMPGGDVEASLNNGGKLMELSTISGDIYLRKTK
nr:hypothetical protein [Bacteroidota bacterium]